MPRDATLGVALVLAAGSPILSGAGCLFRAKRVVRAVRLTDAERRFAFAVGSFGGVAFIALYDGVAVADRFAVAFRIYGGRERAKGVAAKARDAGARLLLGAIAEVAEKECVGI